MEASDIAALPIRLGAARHPAYPSDGVLAKGILAQVAPPGEGLRMDSCDVIGQVSKGIGLPSAIPTSPGWLACPSDT